MAASRGEHARCTEGTLINNRYKVIRECGCGNFSKVFRCVDTQSPTKSHVAVKLLKREYATDAKFENDMLKHINHADKGDEHKVLKLKDSFTWNRHPGFVFPLKGPSLRSRKMSVQRGHVARKEFVQFACEMCSALSFLHHDLSMIHTDLKPENILLDTEVESGLGQGWTIVDFGSASFYKPGKLDSDLISTRPYRAPEVVLGNSWCYRADVWSLACILFEVFTGARMFEVHDDAAHVQQFAQRLGKMPEQLTRSAKNSRKFFDAQGNLLAGARATLPSAVARPSGAGHTPVKAMSDVLVDEPELLDLLRGMLEFDPAKRTTAREALQHPFFEGVAATGAKRIPAASEARCADEVCVAAPPLRSTPPKVAKAATISAPPVVLAAAAAAPAAALAERSLAQDNARHSMSSAMERLKIRNAQAAASAALACGAPSTGRGTIGSHPPAGRPTPRGAYAPTRLW